MDSTGVYEVPIETVYLNDNSSSHFDTFRDSVKIYRVILRYLGPTFLKFMSTSFLSFLIDFLSFCIFFYGTVAIFAGWDTAVSMFSFSREASPALSAALQAKNPVLFASGATTLRVISLILARIISSCCNYLANRKFVFEANRTKNSFLRYAVTAVTVLTLNAVFIELFSLLGIPAWLCSILAQLICYPVSFLMQRTFVFRKRKESI